MRINFNLIPKVFTFLLPSFATADQIDNYIQSAMKKNHIPGLSLIVLKNGTPVKTKSYGLANIELNVPANLSSVYETGSTGKQFTATLIMMLLEKHMINLDDKISKYIKDAPKSWDNITIKRLLTHTSGVRSYDKYVDFTDDYTDEQLVKLAELQPLDFPPGEKWSYSNTGYMLLGVIIKKITGKFYGDLLKEWIFEPLDMKTAGIDDASKIISNRASGYELIKNELKNQKYTSPSLSKTADGSLYMNVLDFAKWSNALDTEKLLKKSTLDLMYEPVKLNNAKPYPYGFGWFITNANGHLLIEHGGEFQGFSSYISRYINDKLAVIILSNRGYIADDIGDMVHDIAGLYDPMLMPKKKIRHR